MAHFARITDGSVVQVIVVNNDAIGGGNFPESEPIGQEFIASIGLDGQWLQCSYSGSFRGAYPGPGWWYDAELDEFAPPPPQESSAAAYARGKADGAAEQLLTRDDANA